MRATRMTKHERLFCMLLLSFLVISGVVYMGARFIHQQLSQRSIEEQTIIIAPGQTARIVGNEDGSDGIPWIGTMEVGIVSSTLYPSFATAQEVTDLGNIATEGQDENDPYLVVELNLANINSQTRGTLIDSSQNSIRENGLNASIFMLQGDERVYLPVSVMTEQPSLDTWTFLLDTGAQTILRLGYSVPPDDKLSDPYLYIVTPLWRLQLNGVSKEVT